MDFFLIWRKKYYFLTYLLWDEEANNHYIYSFFNSTSKCRITPRGYGFFSYQLGLSLHHPMRKILKQTILTKSFNFFMFNSTCFSIRRVHWTYKNDYNKVSLIRVNNYAFQRVHIKIHIYIITNIINLKSAYLGKHFH